MPALSCREIVNVWFSAIQPPWRAAEPCVPGIVIVSSVAESCSVLIQRLCAGRSS